MKSNNVLAARKNRITSFGLTISCPDNIEDELKIYFEECIETFLLRGVCMEASSYKNGQLPN